VAKGALYLCRMPVGCGPTVPSVAAVRSVGRGCFSVVGAAHPGSLAQLPWARLDRAGGFDFWLA